MEQITRKSILETIDTTNEYICKLETLVLLIQEAELQVTASSTRSCEEIDKTFAEYKRLINLALDKREEELKLQVQREQDKGLLPLQECESVISHKLKDAEKLKKDAESILKTGGVKTFEEGILIMEESAFLGTLPAVPDLEIVPNITFQCTLETSLNQILQLISKTGRVSKMGPVQISTIEEKPGALLVKWEEADTEFLAEFQNFRLQMAYDDIRFKEHVMASNFHDIYVGPELEYLARDLKCGVPYTFRVCCQSDIDCEWTAWSLLKVGKTNMLPFSWDLNNSNYSVTNESKIATKVTSEPDILFSKEPQFKNGDAVEFTILDISEGLVDEGIALTSHNSFQEKNFLQNSFLFLNTQGNIFIDGTKKITTLPKFRKGSKVTFTCESVNYNKLRINIESEGKGVTYDWNISTSCLYFAVLFIQEGFKITVG